MHNASARDFAQILWKVRIHFVFISDEYVPSVLFDELNLFF